MVPTAFTVLVHAQERIVEVRYPARPTAEAIDAYERELRDAVQRLGAPWRCLVDQSSLVALAPELVARVTALNQWARAQGMERSVRVVAESALGALQSKRIFRESGISDVGRVVASREEGWRALTEGR